MFTKLTLSSCPDASSSTTRVDFASSSAWSLLHLTSYLNFSWNKNFYFIHKLQVLAQVNQLHTTQHRASQDRCKPQLFMMRCLGVWRTCSCESVSDRKTGVTWWKIFNQDRMLTDGSDSLSFLSCLYPFCLHLSSLTAVLKLRLQRPSAPPGLWCNMAPGPSDALKPLSHFCQVAFMLQVCIMSLFPRLVMVCSCWPALSPAIRLQPQP